ncbi:proton extrusion protein PcxA [Chroococcidiopsis sp. FACHB-1243]|uniref:proton extrusion protein PcxA n=1 Tax=Chroococcidiopsis sp. [FACHB-1243] TaxID=2692781 RepID=UPI001782DBA1|nr:proton extrusion protein PcxA [Chroococcidiopsis sp. [FACHB-1243]]MBD2307067.1 proton extrusion protein PcxA [Chroococcidiopsis sp. [FACHB-1243]]
MRNYSWTQKIYAFLRSAQQWYFDTPERSLDEAYKAALLIKTIEDEHFGGRKISPEFASFGRNTMAMFESDLKKHLKTIRMRLVEFNASRTIFGDPNQTITKLSRQDGINSNRDSFAIQQRNNPSLILEKLRFIDEIASRYQEEQKENLPAIKPQIMQPDAVFNNRDLQSTPERLRSNSIESSEKNKKPSSKTEETGVLPRSILSTLNRLKVELDPSAEEEVVKNFRTSQRRTLISVRLVLLLVIVPFLTFQISKNLVIGPLVDRFRNPEQATMFLNYEMEEKALEEMRKSEERLKFQSFLNGGEEISPGEIEKRLQERVAEIAEEFRAESSNAIKNVFADLLSVGAFIWLLLMSKRELAVLKEFFDQIVYGLSDSAKAFIIILFTDVFVGFHSPHGWEVILSSVSRHLGLPENHDFIFLFIATFPVILDTIFKYWIFRYLNRISPSAVATYRNMNE